MSAAILAIVYGFPLNDSHRRIMDHWEKGEVLGEDGNYRKMTEFEEDELNCYNTDPFESLYCANGPNSGYFGVVLGWFWEGNDTPLSEIMAVAQKAETHKKELEQKMQRIHPALLKRSEPLDVYLIWHSS